ncbi:MAG: protein translocase subunit SecD [Lachnospiraceae bacterium]|nr:protein translocase subunit SecD [Lachnospiraceae bacterium]MBR5789848.1 protein translocase subunit SecD [Lachnospiraceae bacterium]
MKKSRGALVLILCLALFAVSGFYGMKIVKGTAASTTSSGDAMKLGLGLDLAGGVSITYEVVGETPTAEQLSDTVYKLQQRVTTASDGSITEAQVYSEGGNRITVDIPGGSSSLFEELEKPGKLEFRDENGEVQFTGDDIAKATATTQQNQTTGAVENVVVLTLTEEAGERFYEYTSANIGKVLAIYYNDEEISAPQIKGGISGGEAVISGMANKQEAENLAAYIRIGTIDLELKELRSQEVSATLGGSALSNSIEAAGIGLLLVMLFMIIMYLVPGFAAAIGLAIYTGLTMLCLKAFGITLTLPGIAGIILSMGMAVDANVVVFARIREEIATGKSVLTAMKSGYKKALSAVLDGNITTLIAAIVLGIFGSGTVKGFAYTFGIGIVVSMFTALVVVKFLMQALYALGLQDEKFYGKQKERKTIDFLSKKYIFIAIALLVIAVAAITMGVNRSKGNRELNYSLDFVGGTSITADFGKDYSQEEIENTIVPVITDIIGKSTVQSQKVSGTNEIVLKTNMLSEDERQAVKAAIIDKLGVDASTIEFESISEIVSSEMRSDALKAVAIALILMLIYIWFRFKDFRFSASAILALVHDVLIVLASYALVRVAVGNTFIAVMLTIVGYSINATIVIFDRIRENLSGSSTRDPEKLAEIVNRSITQTLSRSINTSLTTFIMVFFLFIMGVTSIREFALPLMVGIVAGAYSSVCLTGALWYMMKAKKNN